MWINPTTQEIYNGDRAVKNAHPNLSFPKVITPEIAATLSLMPVRTDPEPERTDTAVNELQPPALVDGEWVRQWTTRAATPEEAEAALLARTPRSVTKRQGRQQMIAMGVINQVETFIAAITDPTEKALVESYWEDSNEYELDHPYMVQIATALGLKNTQLHNAFIEASQR